MSDWFQLGRWLKIVKSSVIIIIDVLFGLCWKGINERPDEEEVSEVYNGINLTLIKV